MWFLNKETGLRWEITDEELIKRLFENDNYEEVKQQKKTTSNRKNAKKTEDK